MAEERLHDTIEKYLLGELPADDVQKLEADIASDPVLAEQVALQRLGLMGLQRLAAADLREQFDQWDQELDEPKPPAVPPPARNSQNFWIWTTAVSLLLLMAGAFWHFSQLKQLQQNPDPQALLNLQRDSIVLALKADFQQKNDSLSILVNLPASAKDSISVNEIKRLKEEIDQKDKALRDLETQKRAEKPLIAMQLAPASSDTRTRGDHEGDPTLAAEATAFNAGNYAESLRLLKSISQKDPRYAEVIQRIPYSLFYAKEYSAAIPAFLDLLEADQFEEMNAQWYLLLCYVATGQKSETRYLLHGILKNPKHKYYQNAVELKSVLNMR